MSRDIHPVAKWKSEPVARVKERTYWLVRGISYEDAVKLSNTDLISNFQRDTRKNETKFWPGSSGVLTYLKRHLPEGAVVEV
jgi:hypothetical protein